MASDQRTLRWHEELIIGILIGLIGITFLVNGFTYLTNRIVQGDEIVGGPTKQKGIIAIVSLVEQGWWKYPIILVLIAISMLAIKSGIRKYKMIH